ncbi:MAG: hypothetical protein MUC49_11325 [Raineya sp.]|jgi:hypothetical protein|nr:hypothetical protein [Raineya sp.]
MKKLFLLIILLNSINLYAQVDKESNLFKTIRIQDSLLFDIGFNTCNIKQFENLVSESFEFYHDKAGITNTKAAFIASIRDGL